MSVNEPAGMFGRTGTAAFAGVAPLLAIAA